MADPSPLNKPLKYAQQYAEAGFLVFACRPGQKVPATAHGFLDASVDPAEVAAMFYDPRFNIGLACGPQPNGINLLAVDVDAHKGGLDTWRALVEQRPALGAPWHGTPNGGMHVFFDAPSGFRNSQGQIGVGIDTRASGGYVVVPPSRFDDRRYEATAATALLTNRPFSVPGWLLELLDAPSDVAQVAVPDGLPAAQRKAPNPVSVDELSPADYIREVGDWVVELERFGWVHARGSYWVRPGKDPREGHSAVLHDGGPLVVFSTDVPPELVRLGHRTVDGVGFAVSLFELIAAYEFGGDLSSAAREIRRSMPRSQTGPAGRAEPVSEGVGVPSAPAGAASVAQMNLPADFWAARPVLEQIRQAAWARLVSPDGLLANCLARSATLIPPSLRLPAVIGGEATFDFLSCVVAETSGGKSITSAVARDLIPDPGVGLHIDDRAVLFDFPVGSGEGIAQAFMVPEIREDEEGKRRATGRQVVGRQALHLVVDESTGLVAQAQRRGTTIIPTLLSAWSGTTLGQLNASAETRRIVEGGRCRVAAVLNMQSSNAWMLFTEEMTTLGLTSRMLFASAHDPSAPDENVTWPGVLRFEIPPTHQAGTVHMVYDEAIVGHIVAERRAVLRAGVADKSTGHASLLRCKIASILAVWDGRRHVTDVDWMLAGSVCQTNQAVLDHLVELRASQQREQRHRAAVAKGDADAVVETAKERRLIADLSARIVARVPDEGIARSDLRKALTKANTRHRFEPALDMAVANGYLTIIDGRIHRA